MAFQYLWSYRFRLDLLLHYCIQVRSRAHPHDKIFNEKGSGFGGKMEHGGMYMTLAN